MDSLLFPAHKPQNKGERLLASRASLSLHDLPSVLGDPEGGGGGEKKRFAVSYGLVFYPFFLTL